MHENRLPDIHVLPHIWNEMYIAGEKSQEEQLVVYEKYSHMECDVDVSLSTLFIQNGMSFYVL